MKLSSIMLVSAALAFSATSAAWAQTSDQSTAPAPQAKKATDPNQIVCEKIEVVGSRLAVKKVCMTRAEWAEQQRNDRQEVERAQTQRGCNQGSGC
jgi:hypothetical protein